MNDFGNIGCRESSRKCYHNLDIRALTRLLQVSKFHFDGEIEIIARHRVLRLIHEIINHSESRVSSQVHRWTKLCGWWWTPASFGGVGHWVMIVQNLGTEERRKLTKNSQALPTYRPDPSNQRKPRRERNRTITWSFICWISVLVKTWFNVWVSKCKWINISRTIRCGDCMEYRPFWMVCNIEKITIYRKTLFLKTSKATK